MSHAARRTSNDVLADRRFAYAQGAFDDGDMAAAADLAGQVLELQPDFVPALVLLGRARMALGEEEAALAPLRRALALEPEDALGAGIVLARLGEVAVEQAVAPAYVRALFDEYAPRFDRHLLRDLNYRAPALIADRLRRVLGRTGRPFRFARGLDLGCGTGLMGVALEGACTRLDGVDLSPRMLERARETGAYRVLEEGDLLDCLARQETGAIDLVTAADVFVYVASLAPILAASRRILARGGLMGFTVQAHDGQGVVLGEDQRYAHAEAYLHEAAAEAGLSVARLEPASPRQGRGGAGRGLVVVLER